MFVNVKNENYGSEVTTHGDWVIVGNPSSFRYDPLTTSLYRTGSIDIYRYNTLTDQHDLLITMYKPIGAADEVLLAADPTGTLIHTDTSSFGWAAYGIPASSIFDHSHVYWYKWIKGDQPIQIDAASYATKYEDDYGHAIDTYNNVLVVGDRWYNQRIDVSSLHYFVTGSSVDVYNLTALNYTPLDGYVSSGSGFLSSVITPPSGEPVSGSFGFSVSVNNEWLAVGSPEWNGTAGGVHIYRRNIPGDDNNLNFSFFTTITGSDAVSGNRFGYAIDLNKQTGSYSGSLIVGCESGSKAYYFEFTGSSWKEKNKFIPDRTLQPLAFYNINPILSSSNYTMDGFGNSVALFEKDIAIGAPTDRVFYEYSGSTLYKQGACYIYNQCDNYIKNWRLIKKFYGTDTTLKNNQLGYSVDIWEDKLIIGCPKYTLNSLTPCYLGGSTFQEHYCYADFESYVNGQWVLMQKNTSSTNIDWDVVNVYQRKKRFMSPYRSFGYDVAIADKSIVIGSPMNISGSSRSIDVLYTSSIQGSTVIPLDDFSGKSYIYNLHNLKDDFYVGNVFYRNGKIVLNTSGSIFDQLWFNPVNENSYEYEINFDSKQTLYEKQIVCTVEPGEFNTSTNPTAIISQKSIFDINNNGKFDWQDLDVILHYMQSMNTRYDATPTMDWSSSLIKTDEESSVYNYYSANNAYYNSNNDEYISQSYFNILNNINFSEFDFNQDSKIDINDMNILWKYYINRLNQLNYQSYITPSSKRKLFNEIIDHLNDSTKKTDSLQIKPEFITYTSQSMADPTGSYLAPYVTSIGLYNGLDLVAVAKLGSPIKLTETFPINFVVKLDF